MFNFIYSMLETNCYDYQLISARDNIYELREQKSVVVLSRFMVSIKNLMKLAMFYGQEGIREKLLVLLVKPQCRVTSYSKPWRYLLLCFS